MRLKLKDVLKIELRQCFSKIHCKKHSFLASIMNEWDILQVKLSFQESGK